MSGWRNLPFFDLVPFVNPSFFEKELTAIAPFNETVVYATRGEIGQFNKNLEPLYSFPIEDGWTIDFLRGVPNTLYLVSVASRQGEPTVVTVYNMAKIKPAGPSILSRIKVTHNEFPVTTFCMAPDVSVFALGFADGAVTVVRGDILHDRGARQRLVYTAPTAVTGLEFASNDFTVLFVTSLSQIATASTIGKPPSILDKNKGAEYGCVTASDSTLIVARQNEICFYTQLKRGPSIEFTSNKKAIYCYKQYLVLVSQEHSLLGDSWKLTVLDQKNSIIGYQGHLAVKKVFIQWGRLNVLGSDGTLYVLQEKPVQDQLKLLKEQQLFKTALSMAEGVEERDLLLLHQDYADFLQDKGDHESALQHYVASIKLGNTSHVILRYRDSQRVSILAIYLERLYQEGLASPEHLTLLIVCYANTHDYEKLSRFVIEASELPDFNFESAIQICRKSHYSHLASRLAQIWPDPDLVVQIKLEMNDAKGCLDYLFTVSISDALRILIQNSRLLLNKLPVETTAVLISLFTGKFVQRPVHDNGECEKDTKTETVVTPVLQSYQAFMSYLKSASYLGGNLVDAETLQNQNTPSYVPPNPRLIFPSFIGHDNEFVIFLEACLDVTDNFQPSEKDLADLITTLYEMYLTLARRTGNKDWMNKAHQLLQTKAHLANKLAIDMANISLSPSSTTFGASKSDRFREYIRAYRIEDALALLEANPEPELLVLAAKSFVSSADVFIKVRDSFTRLLIECVHGNVLSSVQILELVSVPHVTIGDLRPFLQDHIEEETAKIDRNAKLTKSYREETAAKRKQLDATFPVIKYTNCTTCNLPLDLPTVHFACKHSYHQRCLAGSSYCRVCAPEQQGVEAIRQGQLDSAKEEVFAESLASHEDKLRVITDFISQGALT